MSLPSIFYDAVDSASPEKLVMFFNNCCKCNVSGIGTHCFPVGEGGWEGVTMFLPDHYDDMVVQLRMWPLLTDDFSSIEKALCMLSVFLLKEPNALGMFIADLGYGPTITPAIRDNIDIPDSITDYFSETRLNKPVNVWPNFRNHIADVLWFHSPDEKIPSSFK